MVYSEEKLKESVMTITEMLYNSDHLLNNSEWNALRICAETIKEILNDVQREKIARDRLNQYKLEVHLKNSDREIVIE